MNQKFFSIRKDQKGFSLVELIIVIAIMAVLVGVLAPMYLRFINNSKISTDLRNGQAIASAFSAGYAEGKIENGTYDYVPAGLDIEEFPEISWNAAGSWSVEMTDAGVAHVFIDSDEVYPTTSQYLSHSH